MDKYTILDIVGEGSFGMVMRCLNDSTGQLVAVKKLRNPVNQSSHYLDMIVREIGLLQILVHDHVVQMIDTFRFCGYVYLVFPLMQCNLYKYMELNGGKLTMHSTKICMYQILKGLSYVHSQNIIHRDIKPENILLSTTGVVKICDFGVSRMFCLDNSLNMSTQIGTIWYQAPELLMEFRNYDTTVDIWSIGILFTELTSQYPLVTEETIIQQLYGIANILCCEGIDLAPIGKYLKKHGTSLNIKKHRQKLSSKSYIVTNTAIALQKVYKEWPTCLLEIVAHCLQLNPVHRKNAKQLLSMKFFASNFNSAENKIDT